MSSAVNSNKAFPDRPNIVLIMADDMGYGDLGCYNSGSKIATPNMDRIASEGIKFNDAHASSAVCTPSRYSLLTGRYCWRTRLSEGVSGGYDTPLIEKERLTIASMLKERGYHSACIGKWHVGATFQDSDGNPTEDENKVDFSKPVLDGPVTRGFDYAYYNAGCGTCGPPYGFIENENFVDRSFYYFEAGRSGPAGVGTNGQWMGMMGESWETKDADPIIAEKACEYIEERAKEDAPFFLYLTPNAPHEPCLEQFVPDFARGKSDAGARGDLVWLFDWIVGRVVDTLEHTGQADNTLIIITSDNGALPGDFDLDENGLRLYTYLDKKEYKYLTYDHRSNADWRGYKAHIWEGGHRIPLLAKWPEVVSAGTESDETVCLTDMLATIAAITGYGLTDDVAEDSYNILPAFLGQGQGDRPIREATIHHSSFGVFSIRKGKWKVVLDCADSGGWPTPRGSHPVPGSPGQLYDIESDPGEENNLWDQRSDVVDELKQLLESYQKNGRSVSSR